MWQDIRALKFPEFVSLLERRHDELKALKKSEEARG